MTREEAIEVLKANYPSRCFEQLCEAVDMAIKALEQEPCKDAISRKAVLEILTFLGCKESAINAINDLSPVTPQPKMGKWIEERTYMECPNCHDIWHYEENNM